MRRDLPGDRCVVVLQAEDVGVGLLTKPGNAVEGQKCSASEQKGVATVSAEGVQQRIFSAKCEAAVEDRAP